MIDCHTHRYPSSVYSNPIGFAEKNNEFHWLKLVKPENSSSIQGWASRDEMISDMEFASVQKTVLLGWYWENYQTCIQQNDWHARWIQEDPEKFYAFASIHPEIQNPKEELKKRLDQGFAGIGECHLGVQGSNLKNSNWLKCVEFALDNKWPINFHVTEPVGHEYPGRTPTPFEDFLWLAREFPELKMILAHAGGLFGFYEHNPKVKEDLKNVYYDLAACPLLYDSEIYQDLINVVGYKKVLWGTDYPLRLYPKTQKRPDFLTYKNEILENTNLSEIEKKSIFGENLLSLLSC